VYLHSHNPNLEACHLCYDETKGTPGFTGDPDNCAKFYMCEPVDGLYFNTFPMECPKCSFWDQNLLTCVQVWFDDAECTQTHVTDYLNFTTPGRCPVTVISMLKHFLTNITTFVVYIIIFNFCSHCQRFFLDNYWHGTCKRVQLPNTKTGCVLF